MGSRFTAGTDVEFFLNDETGFVSAIKFIEGGKHSPISLPCGGNVTYDNVAFEVATPVAENEDIFIEVIKKTLIESHKYLPKNVKLHSAVSTEFPEKELDHEEARLFGCDPDFDAWGLRINEVPEDAPQKPFRCVGGHLHVGFVENSGNDFLNDPFGKIMAVKAMDIVLGVPLTLLYNNKGTINRRHLYGKAGCHRPTNYGVEYRALSNSWVFSPNTVRLVYQLAGEALRLVREDKLNKLIDKLGQKEIQRVINESDVNEAFNMWNTVLVKELNENILNLFNQCKNRGTIDIYNEWEI